MNKTYRADSGRRFSLRLVAIISVGFAITFGLVLSNGAGLSSGLLSDQKANQAFAQEAKIPPFVRNVAKFWAQGEVSDGEFVGAIKYLIDNGILKTDRTAKLENKVEELQTKNTQLQNKVDKLSKAISSRNNNNNDNNEDQSSSQNQGTSSTGSSQANTESKVDNEAKVASKGDLTFIMNKGNYAIGDEVEFKVKTGRAGTEVNIQVMQPNGEERFSRNISANSDGVATFSFNLRNYDTGTYTVFVTGGTAQIETEFEVSESGSTSSGGSITGGSGNIQISGGSSGSTSGGGTVELQAVQDYYIAGNSIIVSGTTGSGTTVDIRLIDHNGNEQDSDDATANSEGDFSSFLKIPNDAKSGAWKIVAKQSGSSSSTAKQFNVIGAEDKDTFSVKVEGDEQYSVGDKVIIFGSGVGSSGKKVDIDIKFEESGKIIDELVARSQSGGVFISELPLTEFDYGKNGKYIVEAMYNNKKATAEFYVGSSSTPSTSSDDSENDSAEEQTDFEITVDLNKNSAYASDDTLGISGTVDPFDSSSDATDVALSIMDPSQNPVYVDQLPISSDGSFDTAIQLQDNFGPIGTYTAEVTYTNEDDVTKSDTKTFDFAG